MGVPLPLPAPASWGPPFPCTFASPHSPPALFLFHSFPFTHSACSSARGFLYICCVTLFVFDAFQLLASSGCVFFLHPSLCPSFSLLSISPHSVYFSSLYSLSAEAAILYSHCDFTHRHTETKNGQ